MARLPDLLVVGGMRCGSTSLYRLLDAHPRVCMATPKELHFFDRHFDSGLDWYAQHFASAEAGQLCGEATPGYMYNREVVRRMSAAVPACKYVVILRHPVERAYSHYWMNRALGRETRSFPEAISREAERVRRGEHGGYYVGMSRYHEALTRLESFVGPEQLAVVVLEELRDDPHAVWQSLCEHLQIEADGIDPAAIIAQVNAFQRYRSLRLRRWGKRLPERVQDVIGRVNAYNAPYPALPEADRRMVWSQLVDDTQRLESWFQRAIPAWREAARGT
jgi:hypothetical protein